MAIDALFGKLSALKVPAAGTASPISTPSSSSSDGISGGTFGDSLHRLLASVDDSAASANEAVGGMLDGTGDVHTAMIALQRAEMALEVTVQVRNKFVQAYQDVMRMSI